MAQPDSIIHQFYTAFRNRDAVTMARCYHAEAVFSDPVFTDLRGSEIGEMWKMLVSRGKDTKIQFSDAVIDGATATCNWRADYTFSGTGRFVTNHIRAEFELKDNLIYRHVDNFDLSNGIGQAFGLMGKYIGWTGFFKNRLRKTARATLNRWIQKKTAQFLEKAPTDQLSLGHEKFFVHRPILRQHVFGFNSARR